MIPAHHVDCIEGRGDQSSDVIGDAEEKSDVLMRWERRVLLLDALIDIGDRRKLDEIVGDGVTR